MNFVAFREGKKLGESTLLGDLARECIHADVDIASPIIRTKLVAHAEELERQETEFIDRARTFVLGWRRHQPSLADDDAKDFFLGMLARSAIENVAASLGKSLTINESIRASQQMLISQRLLLNFQYKLYREIDSTKLDLGAGKRINDMWDLNHPGFSGDFVI